MLNSIGGFNVDLLSLDSNYGNARLVNSYESLIWTERFTDVGEYSAVFSDIPAARSALPIDRPVKLMDSPQIFITENHVIEKDQNDVPKVTISGRSMECVYERRSWPVPYNDSSSSGSGTKWDIMFNILNVYHMRAQPFEIFRPEIFSAYTYYPTTVYPYVQENGPFSDQLQKIRVAENMGVSPEINDPPEFTFPWPTWKINMKVYEGVDRSIAGNESAGVNAIPYVLFSVADGTFTDEAYIFSRKNFKNIANVYSSDKRSATVTLSGWDSAVSGKDRRVLYVDASDIDVTGMSTATLVPILQTRGRFELAKHNHTVSMQGKVKGIGGAIYRQDYGLGDLVTVGGNYGITETARVSEYIRTEDRNGEIGYPSLIVQE